MSNEAELLPGTLDLLILKAVSLGPLHSYGVLLRNGQISGRGSGNGIVSSLTFLVIKPAWERISDGCNAGLPTLGGGFQRWASSIPVFETIFWD
jgi:hypothetical protein